MTNDEYKAHLQNKTGIPADLLTGDTPEDNLTIAASLLAFKQQNAQEQQNTHKSTAEQFADWFKGETGEAHTSDSVPIQSEVKRGYPKIRDGGEVMHGLIPKSPEEQFAEWAWKIGLAGF